MRQKASVLLALLTAVLSAQWLETTIYLPDSLGGPRLPDRIFYNPGNNTVFVFGYDRAVLVLDGVTHRKIARIDLPEYAGNFCYNPQENKLYVTEYYGNSVYVIDAAAIRLICTINLGHGSFDITYNPNLNRVYTVGDEYVTVIDCAADTAITTVTLPSYSQNIACAWLVNKVYCVMNNEEVAVIDCTTDSIIKTFYSGAGPYGMLYNHLTNRLYICEGYDEDITIVNCERDSVIRWVIAGYEPRLLCLNTVSNKFYCADWDGNWFGIYDGAGDSLIRWIHLGYNQRGLVFDSIDNLVYLSLTDRDSIAVIDGVTNQVVRIIPTPGSLPYGLGYNPTANCVYGAEQNSNTVTVYDGTSSEVLTRIELRFSPNIICPILDLNRLYCASYSSHHLIPLELPTHHIRPAITLPHPPFDIVYSPRRQRAYSFSLTDSAIRVIDCAIERLRTAILLPLPPNGACYAPDLDRIYCPINQIEEIAVVSCSLNVVSGYIPDIYHQPRVLGYVLGKKLLYAVAFEDRRLVVIDADSNHIITSIGLGGEPRAICYIPGHNLIACAVTGLDGLFAIDCSTHTITGFIPTPHEPVSLLYNPLQDRLYCSAGHLESLWVINPALLRIEKSIPTDGVIQAMTFDSTVNRIYATSGWPAKVIFIDCCRDSLIASISLPTYPLGEIVLHPEERRVYVGLPALSAIGVIKDTLPVSIAEQPSISGMAKTLPTIVRGVLPLSRDINTHSQITLVDISGRKVLTLHPGANDLSHLAPGVYFIKEKNGIKMKVVIAR